MITKVYNEYYYMEFPEGAQASSQNLEKINKIIQKATLESKRVVICFPNRLKVSKNYLPFFKLFRKKKDDIVFTSKSNEAYWSTGWGIFAKAQLPIAEYHKAIAWAKDELPEPEMKTDLIGSSVYVKWQGTLFDNPLLRGDFQRSIDEAKYPAKFRLKPKLVETSYGKVWTYLDGGIVLDIADVSFIDQDMIAFLREELHSDCEAIEAKNLFFVTSGNFQSWLLKARFDLELFQESAHIFRLVPDEKQKEQVSEEVHELAQFEKNFDYKTPLFVHTLNHPNEVAEKRKFFFPEIFLIEVKERSQINTLKELLPQDMQARIYPIAPAFDPSIKVLSPELLTPGYDNQLFAEFLYALFQRNHGHPNNTKIYHFETDPKSFTKVMGLIHLDFQEEFNEQHQAFIQILKQCETLEKKEGSFFISTLEEQIINFKTHLHFSKSGGLKLLSQYEEIFPKNEFPLCRPLQLYLKMIASCNEVEIWLNFVEVFTQVVLKQDAFKLETRWQVEQTLLTIECPADETSSQSCLTLFSLLNASEAFDILPDKEILIEIISLLWENKSSDEGFLITLTLGKKEMEFKAVNHADNTLFLKANIDDSSPIFEVNGRTPYSMSAQTRLFKIISLFFRLSPEKNADSWRSACFEAVSRITAQSDHAQNVHFILQSQGENVCLRFSSDAKNDNLLPDSAKKVWNKGADEFTIDRQGRDLFLVRGEVPDFDEELEEEPNFQVSQEEKLAEIKEEILDQVNKAKTQQFAFRRTQLLQAYDFALEAYKEKHGASQEGEEGEEDEFEEDTIKQRKVQDRVLTRVQPDLTKITKWRKNFLVASLAFLLLCVGGIWYVFTQKLPVKKNQLLPQVSAASPNQVIVSDTIEVKLESDPAKNIIREICRNLYRNRQPSQAILNQCLKDLYLARLKFPESGDIYNLIGRIYSYKIYLDQENTFSIDWKKRWKNKCQQYWIKAEKIYRQGKVESTLKIKIRNWMPEKKHLPEDSKDIIYSSLPKAVEDVQSLQKNFS